MLTTYDFELFLGSNSGELDSTLIFPTEKILGIHRKSQTCAIFFVDTIFLCRLKEICLQDFNKVMNQLRDIVDDGHFIYPHLHGHWHDAEYDVYTRTWKLENLRYYRFNSLPTDLKDHYFTESMQLLKSIVGNLYPIDSFRAGGWTIQPFEDFIPYFLKYGIRNEYSVIPGKKIISNVHFFDFTPINNTKPYQFENDLCKEEINGRFTEYPISTITLSPLETWIDFKLSGLQKRLSRNKSKGITVNAVIKEQTDIISPNQKRIVVSFEGMNLLRFIKFVKGARRNQYFHSISHPKLLRKIDILYMSMLFRIIQK
jgi:hypothetical protein